MRQPTKSDVVLVHGFLNTARVFRRLVARLEGEGYACHVPTLRPRDGRRGVPDWAEQVKAFVESELGASRPFILVGFSMGAVVARYYLQELGGASRVRVFFSIAGPHRGTWPAYCYPGQGTRDLRPRSSVLRSLENGEERMAGVKVYSYSTPLDLMILPESSTRLPQAEHTMVWSPLHAFLPRDDRLIDHLCATLARIEAAPPPTVSVPR